MDIRNRSVERNQMQPETTVTTPPVYFVGDQTFLKLYTDSLTQQAQALEQQAQALMNMRRGILAEIAALRKHAAAEQKQERMTE